MRGRGRRRRRRRRSHEKHPTRDRMDDMEPQEVTPRWRVGEVTSCLWGSGEVMEGREGREVQGDCRGRSYWVGKERSRGAYWK